MQPPVLQQVAWPSGLRRWFKAPVSSGAWVRIPPLPITFSSFGCAIVTFGIDDDFLVDVSDYLACWSSGMILA